MFCSIVPFLSVFFVFHKKDLVLWNLISKCVTSTSEWVILNSKDIVDICKVHFCINKLFIQCNKRSYCVPKTSGVKTYLYLCYSLLVLVCPMCVCLCVWFQILLVFEIMSSVSTYSEFDTSLHKTHNKVPLLLRYQGSTSLFRISLTLATLFIHLVYCINHTTLSI